MEQHLCVFVALVLVSLCKGWVAPDFCRQKPCPEYQLISASNDQGFEERRYVDIDLITTTIGGQNTGDLREANSRLDNYCKSQRQNGHEINSDTWPVMITVTEGAGDPVLTYSWFIPPGTEKTDSTDSVRVETRSCATVYVKVFGGMPSISRGQENAKLLRAALNKAGKTFNQHTYTGASFDPLIAVWRHNEIWICAA